MVFVPKYDTKYIEPLVYNLVAYLSSGEEEALRWANSGELMDPTKAWRKSRWYNTIFPVTSVIPIRTIPAESSDASRIEEQHLITIETEIDGSDPDKIMSAICRRINAYDALLRKIPKDQLLADMNLTTAGGEWLDIGEHKYEYFAQSPTLYKLTGSFSVSIHVLEGAHK